MNTYAERQSKSGIKVGDYVLVKESAASHSKGWDNSWSPSMDQAVGQTFQVIGIFISGINLDFKNGWYKFPYWVLEKVDSKNMERMPRIRKLLDFIDKYSYSSKDHISFINGIYKIINNK